MDKLTGDDDLLVDIDLDLPTNVAAASGWMAPDASTDDDAPADPKKADDAVAPANAEELEAARRAAQEAQARLDALQEQAQADREARLKAQEEAQKNQTYALNAHVARMESHLARVQADHEQLNTSISAWKSHVDMAKQRLAAADEVGDAKAKAEMMAQIAEAHSMITQLEAGRMGAASAIEEAKRQHERAMAAAHYAREQAEKEATAKSTEKDPKPEAKVTPDDYIKQVRGVIGDHGADWFDKHREFITDKGLHKKMQNFVEDWVDRNGEGALRSQKFTEALDERFGFAKPQPKKAAAAPPPEEDDDMEDETPRAPAAPVSRQSNSVAKPNGGGGSKVRLSADEAATAQLMYPDLSPADARKKYATNKARLIADNRL